MVLVAEKGKFQCSARKRKRCPFKEIVWWGHKPQLGGT